MKLKISILYWKVFNKCEVESFVGSGPCPMIIIRPASMIGSGNAALDFSMMIKEKM